MTTREIIWIDIETTGLDPQRDSILEIAVMRAPFEDPFNATPAYHAVLQWLGDPSKLHPAVQAMHARTGLFQFCAASGKTIYGANVELCALVPELSNPDDAPVLGARRDEPALAGAASERKQSRPR